MITDYCTSITAQLMTAQLMKSSHETGSKEMQTITNLKEYNRDYKSTTSMCHTNKRSILCALINYGSVK